MLRHALRRLLWVVPILIGVTLASFALLSYVPDPADDPTVLSSLSNEQAAELRRSRFLDLPRFFNEQPVDLVKRATDAVAESAGTEKAAQGSATLVRLGGAALPYILPRLDALEPAQRARVALALAPIARRMGLESPETTDPGRAVVFWNRFWAERSVDFRAANARRAARRLSLHATEARESDLAELDTFALPQIMEVLGELSSAGERETVAELADRVIAVKRLVDAAAHATERDDRITQGATAADALACLRRWEDWWLSHEADYTAYAGMRRLLAMVSDTQYAKWAHKVLVLGFGAGSDRSPVLERMRERAGPTLAILAGALAIAYLAASGLGLWGALRAGAMMDPWVGASLLAFVTPTACLATWIFARTGPHLFVAIAVLALALLASPLSQLRTVMLELMGSDHVRAARALGFGPVPVLVRHVMRSALLPLVALASVELPLALGGAFVVEKVFGLRGIGDETVRAVQTHDVAWLVGLAFVTSLAVTLASIAADLATAVLDPRLSLAALRNQRAAE
jgi:ABC-type dipeptide/oligopeptide/nickel transport system permease component